MLIFRRASQSSLSTLYGTPLLTAAGRHAARLACISQATPQLPASRIRAMLLLICMLARHLLVVALESLS